MQKISDENLVKLATCSAIVVASILVAGKGYAWYLTSSLSIKASLVDSLLDGFASLLNFVAIYHALRPADNEHRFGHGKAEALASLGQSIFIAISAAWLLREVIWRLYNPEQLIFSPLAIIVMISASVLTFTLILGQRYVISKTQSLAVSSDSLHYQTDLMSDLGVLLSFYLSSYFTISYFDTGVGALISVYLLYSTWIIAKKALDILMDRELPDEIIESITKIAQSHHKVLGIHDLRTRSSGQNEFIQMHLDLDKDMSLYQAHSIAEEIAAEINKVYPKAEVIIHQDPVPEDPENPSHKSL
ncbi:MAG: cation diffusion facilitator family transporter [Alphaproteobacteria bacterium]|nr:cation diffusion facilitator family transporter [Alphaproteobacteria bacterium]